MTRYLYRRALGALFHVDEALARRQLPAALVPLGARPGNAILSALVFDFVESEAGPFTEVALMWVVPPDARGGADLPLIGLYPFLLATSTAASRDLARQRLRLPVHDALIQTRFHQKGDDWRAEVDVEGAPLLQLAVQQRRRNEPASRLYQCFTHHDRLYQAPVRMQGWLSEHQEETGRLTLADHPWVRDLNDALDDPVPFREQLVDGGQEDFGDMEPLG